MCHTVLPARDWKLILLHVWLLLRRMFWWLQEDYEVKDLFDTDFKYNVFGKSKGVSSSRRRAMESVFADVQFPIMACTGGKC